MKNLESLLMLFACITMTSCKNHKEYNHTDLSSNLENTVESVPSVDPEDMMASANLTVSEGKRLIAKGVAAMPEVREKMQKGTIIITRGTTNTYLAEELAGLKEPHGAFLTGHFVPVGARKVSAGISNKLSEIILVDGKKIDVSYEEGLKMLKEGDLIFKGGNLLNYAKKQAAVCIGAPDGGTVYRLLPYVGKNKARLIVPIGLEKDTSSDLNLIDANLNKKNERLSSVPKSYVYQDATLFTEIEAIKQFADVKVFPYGLGGVKGREGGLSLVIAGKRTEVEKAISVIKSVQGEHPFHE